MMDVKQGQEYRIVYEGPVGTRLGQASLDCFRHTITNDDGEQVRVEDIIGDVIYASENVDYPRGPQTQYRSVRWIEEHPGRFERIES